MQDTNKSIEIRTEAQLECFKLRFKGHTYEQISEKINHKYKPMTLEVYFAKGGKWHEAYEAWRTWQTDQLKDQMNSLFLAQAVESSQQVINISRGVLYGMIEGPDGKQIKIPIALKGDTVLRANQDILDRAGFKPPEKIEASNPEDIADRIFKKYQMDEIKK